MRTSASYSIPSELASASFSPIPQMPWLPTLLLIGYAQLLVLIQTTWPSSTSYAQDFRINALPFPHPCVHTTLDTHSPLTAT